METVWKAGKSDQYAENEAELLSPHRQDGLNHGKNLLFFYFGFEQIKVLNQERAMAERKNMIYWTEQQVTHEREEALMTQVPYEPISFNVGKETG